MLLIRCVPESAALLQHVRKPFNLHCYHSPSLVMMLWAVVAMFGLVVIAADAAAVIIDSLIVLEMNWNTKKQDNSGSSRSKKKGTLCRPEQWVEQSVVHGVLVLLLVFWFSLWFDMVGIGLGSAHPLQIGIVVAWGYWIAISWVPRTTVEQEEENRRWKVVRTLRHGSKRQGGNSNLVWKKVEVQS